MTAELTPAVATEVDDLRRAVAARPDAVALVDEFDCCVTFRELDAAVAALVKTFGAAGLERGALATIVLPNSFAFTASFLACRAFGAVVNPIAPLYGEGDIRRMLAVARPELVITTSHYRDKDLVALLRDLAPSAALVDMDVVGGAGANVLRRLQPGQGSPSLDDHAAFVVFTSGTEGSPKAVVHTSAALRHASVESSRMSGLTSEDIFATAAPLGHLTGLFSGLRSPLALGAKVVLLDRWDPERAMRIVEQHGVTFMHGPPTMLIDLVHANRGLSAPVAPQQYRVAGAAVASSVVAEALSELGLRVVRGYGSSETLIVTNSLGTDELELRLKSEGAILPGVKVSFGESQDVAEIAVRGATRFMGYLASAERERGVDVLSSDAWFATGDLGELVTDRHLRVTGRIKDIIVRGGLNISAAEVEALVASHPEVAEAVVVSVPDPRLGERACAVVTGTGELPDVHELSAFLSALGLATYKIPEYVEVVDLLPRTGAGKVARSELRELVRDRLAARPASR